MAAGPSNAPVLPPTAPILDVVTATDQTFYRMMKSEREKLDKVWDLLKTDSFTLMLGVSKVNTGLDDGEQIYQYLKTHDGQEYGFGSDNGADDFTICKYPEHRDDLFDAMNETVQPKDTVKRFYQYICGPKYISPFQPDVPLHYAQTLTVMQGKVRLCSGNVQILLKQCVLQQVRKYGVSDDCILKRRFCSLNVTHCAPDYLQIYHQSTGNVQA
jgi:hypothetical protein